MSSRRRARQRRPCQRANDACELTTATGGSGGVRGQYAAVAAPRRPSRVAAGVNSVSVSSSSAPLCPERVPQSIGKVAHHLPWAVAGRSTPGTFVIRKRIGVGAALRWMFASAGSRRGQVMSRPPGSPRGSSRSASPRVVTSCAQQRPAVLTADGCSAAHLPRRSSVPRPPWWWRASGGGRRYRWVMDGTREDRAPQSTRSSPTRSSTEPRRRRGKER